MIFGLVANYLGAQVPKLSLWYALEISDISQARQTYLAAFQSFIWLPLLYLQQALALSSARLLLEWWPNIWYLKNLSNGSCGGHGT